MEFIFMIMAATSIVIIFSYLFAELYDDTMQDKRSHWAGEIASMVQQEIYTAHIAHDGYERSFEIPMDLQGYDYSVELRNTTILVNYTAGKIVPPTQGNITRGTNTITKKNNVVCINC